MADKPTNKERLKELGEKIEAGIREVFDSDKYAEYLKVMSRFPTYSVNNQMLIRLQRPIDTNTADLIGAKSDPFGYRMYHPGMLSLLMCQW